MINLVTSYYIPANANRQNEINQTLLNNSNNDLIKKIKKLGTSYLKRTDEETEDDKKTKTKKNPSLPLVSSRYLRHLWAKKAVPSSTSAQETLFWKNVPAK